MRKKPSFLKENIMHIEPKHQVFSSLRVNSIERSTSHSKIKSELKLVTADYPTINNEMKTYQNNKEYNCFSRKSSQQITNKFMFTKSQDEEKYRPKQNQKENLFNSKACRLIEDFAVKNLALRKHKGFLERKIRFE